jgi:hypothetical protein
MSQKKGRGRKDARGGAGAGAVRPGTGDVEPATERNLRAVSAERDEGAGGGEKPIGAPIDVPISMPSTSDDGTDSLSPGPAPDFAMPDVYAPAESDHAPGSEPAPEAGHPGAAPAGPPSGSRRGPATGARSPRPATRRGPGARARRGAAKCANGQGGAAGGAEAPAVHRPSRDARVGLFVGREWSFPPEFLKAVERRDAGVVAELAKIGAPRFDEAPAYDLLIDRISHEVPTYRTYLKQAALRGAAVVNNPFMWSADDKFFGASLADRLGVASPKTVVLPNREYVPGIVPEESLRNLEYPLDWQAIVEYVGMPCILKDAHGGGWKEVYVCKTPQELLHHYNSSGLLTMIVQEFIEFEHFVRCLVIGREEVLPMKYDPKVRKYVVDHAHLSADLGARIVGDARKLCRALGYDMNSMEFAIRGGVPYAIDFMNPAPDMDVYSLTPTYFEWAVEHMADMAVRLATAARDGKLAQREPAWGSLFTGAVGAGASRGGAPARA